MELHDTVVVVTGGASGIASAAGLLTLVGSTPCSATKHAAVAIAERLAITYGDAGVKVSCLCPQGVLTPMLETIGRLRPVAGRDTEDPAQPGIGVSYGRDMSAPETTPRPVLRRSKTDKVFGGVAGGLGRYLAVDPILIRVAFAVLTLAAGTGIFLYVIGWIAIPEEKEGDPVGPVAAAGGMSGRTLVGGLIVLAGALLLLNQVVPDMGRFVWPALVIVVGVAIVLRGRR